MASMGYRVSVKSAPGQVFDVLTDFARYGEWNPWIASIEGTPAQGGVCQVKFRHPTLFKPLQHTLVALDPPDSFTWRETGFFRSLVYSERKRNVYARSDGSAIYSTRLKFFGPLAWLGTLLYGPVLRRALREEAKALKAYCEANYPLSESAASGKKAVKPLFSVDLNKQGAKDLNVITFS